MLDKTHSMLLYATLPYSTLLYATLRYSTLPYATATLRYSTLLYSTLLYATLLYATLLMITVITVITMITVITVMTVMTFEQENKFATTFGQAKFCFFPIYFHLIWKKSMSIARVKTILRRLEREISQENTFLTKSRRESREDITQAGSLHSNNFGIQSTNFGIWISLHSNNLYVLILKDEKGSKSTPPTYATTLCYISPIRKIMLH
jgi:hypothetical protein